MVYLWLWVKIQNNTNWAITKAVYIYSALCLFALTLAAKFKPSLVLGPTSPEFWCIPKTRDIQLHGQNNYWVLVLSTERSHCWNSGTTVCNPLINPVKERGEGSFHWFSFSALTTTGGKGICVMHVVHASMCISVWVQASMCENLQVHPSMCVSVHVPAH